MPTLFSPSTAHPYPMMNDAFMPLASDALSRRAFVRSTCCSALLVSMGIGLGACDSAGDDDGGGGAVPTPGGGIAINGNVVTLDLTGTQARAVASAGGFLLVGGVRVAVINVDGTTIRAFSSVCPHQSCDVNSFSNSRINCPCHGSQFDAGGKVTRGPAQADLRALAVTRSGNTVTITT